MKKLMLFTLILCLGTSLFAQSQTFKAFKVDLGLLYAVPTGDGAGAGIGFFLEPQYNLTDQFSLGFMLEFALLSQADDLENGGFTGGISGVNSFSLTADYQFSTNKVRPFAGLGVGLYSLGSVETSFIDEPIDVDLGNKFGFSPRLGLNIGHFQLAVQYHIITGQDIELFNKNYLAFKVGFEIGGGPKG